MRRRRLLKRSQPLRHSGNDARTARMSKLLKPPTKAPPPLLHPHQYSVSYDSTRYQARPTHVPAPPHLRADLRLADESRRLQHNSLRLLLTMVLLEMKHSVGVARSFRMKCACAIQATQHCQRSHIQIVLIPLQKTRMPTAITIFIDHSTT